MTKWLPAASYETPVIGHNQHELWYKEAHHDMSYLLILYEQMIGTTLPE